MEISSGSCIIVVKWPCYDIIDSKMYELFTGTDMFLPTSRNVEAEKHDNQNRLDLKEDSGSINGCVKQKKKCGLMPHIVTAVSFATVQK